MCLEKIKKKVNENVFGSNVCRFHYIQTLLELEDTDAENILLSVKSNLEQSIKKGFLLFLADYLELISELLFRREAQQLALMLFSASAKFRKEYLIPVPQVRQDFYNQTWQKLGAFFETTEFDRLWVQGQSTSAEECLELVNVVD